MQTFAFAIDLKSPEAAARYIDLHRNVPPEIAGPGGALDAIGVTSMEIFHAAPTRLYMMVRARDGFDPVVGFNMANDLHPVVQAWDDCMHGELLVRLPVNDTRLNWFAMTPVFAWHRAVMEGTASAPHAITLLDCTLRDGGFQTDWVFSDALMRGLLPACHAARAGIVEVGYLPKPNAARPSPLDGAVRVMSEAPVPAGLRLAVMADTKDWVGLGARAARAFLDGMRGLPVPVDVLRLATSVQAPAAHLEAAIGWSHELTAQGVLTTINLMHADTLTAADTADVARKLSKTDPRVVIYLADSFGAMRPEDVKIGIRQMRAHLPNAIGFHAHDNLGLAVANTQAALDAGATYVDATFAGLGRGAGNAAMEAVMNLVGGDINHDVVHGYLNDHIEPLRRRHVWGPSAVYAQCAALAVHPSYGQDIEARVDLSLAEKLATVRDLAARGARTYEPGRVMAKMGAVA